MDFTPFSFDKGNKYRDTAVTVSDFRAISRHLSSRQISFKNRLTQVDHYHLTCFN